MADAYDVVIIGAGHNGLVCAYYLAAAGLKVKVVEQRSVVGGAAVTEEFVPGFRNSVASYTVSLLNPKIIRDLDLPRHRLRIVERRLANFFPLPDGQYLKTGAEVTRSEIARFSPSDADRYEAYSAEIEAVADVLRDLTLQQPPNLVDGNWRTALLEGWHALSTGNRLRRLSTAHRRARVDGSIPSAPPHQINDLSDFRITPASQENGLGSVWEARSTDRVSSRSYTSVLPSGFKAGQPDHS